MPDRRTHRRALLTSAAIAVVFVVHVNQGPASRRPTSQPPDQIVFQSDRDGSFDIFVTNADGTGLRQVTRDPSDDLKPSRAPPARDARARIAFQSDRDGDGEISTIDGDGNGLRQLTHNLTSDTDPAWSPDGSAIAFVGHRGGETDVFVMRPDASAQRPVTADDAIESSPPWSPDGDELVFGVTRGSGSTISRIDIRTRARSEITDGTAVDSHPSWFRFSNPNGSSADLIAFDRVPSAGGDYEVMTFNVANGALNDLTMSRSQDVTPVWSSGGGHVAFVTDRDRDRDLYVMNADGTQQTRLTSNGSDDGEPDNRGSPPEQAKAHAPQVTGGGLGCTAGTPGDNVMRGTSHTADRFCGLGGNDRLYGYGKNDILDADDGRDRLYGGSGDDFLDAQDGHGGDWLYGGPGRDTGRWDSGDHHSSISRQR